jgi:trans-aconitate methyltransferase
MEKSENLKFDLFYLKENRKIEPKESFKFILNKAGVHISNDASFTIADIGCATGDLLHYIHSLFPKATLGGFDIQEELLAKARTEVPAATFVRFDLLKDLPTRKFDIVFMCGLHAAFDDPHSWISKILQFLKPNGRAFVYGNFNPEPIDVLIKVRPSGSTGPYMANWNMVSQKTCSSILNEQGFKTNFTHFQIPIDIPKNAENPLRTWTFRYEDGTRGTINGAQLLHQDYLLEIWK